MFFISPSFRVNFNFSMCKPIFSVSPAPICSFITNTPHSFLCSLFLLSSSLFFLCFFLFLSGNPLHPSFWKFFHAILHLFSCPSFSSGHGNAFLLSNIFSPFVVLLGFLIHGIRLTYTGGGRTPVRKHLYYARSIWKTIFHLLY